MRFVSIFIGAILLTSLSGCSDDKPADKSDSASTNRPAPPAAEPSTVPAPKAQKTYVPASGDPKTHELSVTIRDEGELDAYTADADNTCTGNVLGGRSNQLLISGPNDEYELAPLASFDIPATARLLPNGACEATMAVTAPYAPHYLLGVTIHGRGIAGPDDPAETKVATNGNSQSVIVLL